MFDQYNKCKGRQTLLRTTTFGYQLIYDLFIYSSSCFHRVKRGYIFRKKGLLPEDKVSASKSGATLYQKVSKVTDFMAKKKYIDDTLSKGIKTITKDQNSIWGIDTIQAYLHNNQFSPSTETLLTTWDNIQEFMVTLWNNIEKDDA